MSQYPSSSGAPEYPIQGMVHCSFTTIVDETTSSIYTYICEAIPGSATFEPKWRISRLTVANQLLQYANGNGNFSNIADNRALLNYI